jgi:hypothetical protein
MICRSLVFAGLLALGGCAQEGLSGPNFVGLSDIAPEARAAAQPESEAEDAPEALRHVQSNKVLGAMAFQRVTGRTVDPESLSGHAP